MTNSVILTQKFSLKELFHGPPKITVLVYFSGALIIFEKGAIQPQSNMLSGKFFSSVKKRLYFESVSDSLY